MDLRFTPEETAFRDKVRAFMKEKLPAAIRSKLIEGRRLSKDDLVDWQRILNAKGWAVPHWPKEWGGTGWGPVEIYLFRDEMQQAPAPEPLPFGVNMLGPVLIAFGNDAQKKNFLPRIANLDDWWCQGFSEPGAGSDLASLKTSAKRVDGHYVVNGQKTWTTLAQYADWIFCLVRTDPARQEAGRHFIPDDRHENAGHHRAPDPDHRRRQRSQRSVLRRREGAGRESDRPGEQGLGLRQIPARQRAHRHRAGRRFEGAHPPHQRARRPRTGRRQAADGRRALSAPRSPPSRSNSRRWK